MLGEHYAGIRRWAPAFLDAFVFQAQGHGRSIFGQIFERSVNWAVQTASV